MRKIICNPMNLPYSFQEIDMAGKLRIVCREAADPTLIYFKDKYYLFPSMTGGFFWSENLYDWKFVEKSEIPIYDYAPDVRQVGEYLYFSASKNNGNCTFYRTKNPISDKFEEVSSPLQFWDPNLFQDDDGKVYLYWGCTNDKPIYGVELDKESMIPFGEPSNLIYGNPQEHGWERTGVNNDPEWFENPMAEMIAKNYGSDPFVEGAWMTKYDGSYYLQYAAPATERNTYADGVYISKNPLGPFEYASYNPVSVKPGGFITGAGHGSTLEDTCGNWWHASTMRICVNHMYERRLGFFPCGFDSDGVMFCNQNFADYPMVLTDMKRDPWDTFAGMMLLSFKKPVTATSTLEGYPTYNMTDEDIRTKWVAGKKESGETVTMDLLEIMTVEAIQLNFAEHDIPCPVREEGQYWHNSYSKRYINLDGGYIRYLLEGSQNGNDWCVLEDKKNVQTDLPHDLIVLEKPKKLRFIRLTGYEMPYQGYFSLSGLRVFGKGNGELPKESQLNGIRISKTSAKLSWTTAEGAIGYNIRYGITPEKLYHSWLVYEQTELELNSLNAGVVYYACVDSFNENGITEGKLIMIGL